VADIVKDPFGLPTLIRYRKTGGKAGEVIARERTVRDLGWLLRHAKEAQRLHITLSQGPSQACWLVADGADWRYVCLFSDREICRLWIEAPRFRHAHTSESEDWPPDR
jgi:hypothetical protein